MEAKWDKIKCDHYIKQVFWFSFDFNESNGLTSLNLSETPTTQVSTGPPSCKFPWEPTMNDQEFKTGSLNWMGSQVTPSSLLQRPSSSL